MRYVLPLGQAGVNQPDDCVKGIQSSNSLPATGIWDAATFNALDSFYGSRGAWQPIGEKGGNCAILNDLQTRSFYGSAPYATLPSTEPKLPGPGPMAVKTPYIPSAMVAPQDTIFGIPTLYVGIGAVALLLLLMKR